MTPIVEANGLTKAFGSHTAVDHLSFAVEEGEVFGLLGPNGAGKTTTIRMLSCLIAPSKGGATVAGYNIAENPLAVRQTVGILTENQLAKSLSMQLGIPIIAPDIQLIDQQLAKRFSEAFLRRQEAVPAFEKEGIVTLIMGDPLSEAVVNDFKKYFDVKIEPAIASRSSIHQLLDALFNKIEYGLKESDALASKDLIIGNESYAKDSRDDAVKIVNYLISAAITEGASDIHIEPESYNLRVRYRIDGVLQHKTDLPKQLAPSIVSRIKVMGGMNIAEGNMSSLNPKRPVRDMHFALEGPVVRHLQEVFAEDWCFATGELLEGEGFFP